MKFKKVPMILTIALIVMCSFALGAYAASSSEPITAYMSYDVSVNYNGKDVAMKNANGERVFPIIYNGTTYIPIRAMGDLFGVPVNWDGATRTVLLGNSAKTQGVDLINTFKPYAASDNTKQVQSSDKESKVVGGVEVDHWLLLMRPNPIEENSAYAYYNLGGKYNTLTFEVTTTEDTILYVYGDNEVVLGEISLVANQVPQKVKVQLMKTTQLHFQAKLNKTNGNWSNDNNINIINAYLT